jgi:hypothetical protein
MKKIVLVLAAAVLLVSCSNNPPPASDPTRNLSPTGRAAYQSLRVIKALDVLRDVAAAGERQNPKLISADAALKVISYHKQVVQTMGAVPDGWKTVAMKGLDQLVQDLSAAERTQLQPFVDLLKTLFNTFVPGGAPPLPAELTAALAYDTYLLTGGM